MVQAQFLKEYDGYFDVDKAMIEHVYRGIKNSLKIRSAYSDTLNFINWLVYLLSPEQKKFDDSIQRMESNLIKLVGKESFLNNFYNQAKEANTKVKKKDDTLLPYFMFDKVTLTWLGSSVMFYCILRSVVDVTDKALTDSMYKLEGTLDWEEAITSYVLCELNTINKLIMDVYNEVKNKMTIKTKKVG